MKKSIIALLALAIFQSCEKKEATPDYVILSGEIKNLTNEEIPLQGVAFQTDIVLNDSKFLDTLNIAYDGMYQFGNQQVYLQKGKNLTINADAKDFEAISYSGDLAVENNYLAEKSRISNAVLGRDLTEFYSLDEQEFLKKLDEMVNKQTELFNKTTFTVESFKTLEPKNIAYEKDVHLDNYKLYHGLMTGNRAFQVSENFPKLSITDYDNDQDILFSEVYRQLVMKHFEQKNKEAFAQINPSEDADDAYYKVIIDNFKTFKSDNVKTQIASFISSRYMKPGNESVDFLYNEINANVANETFKKELTERYNKIKKLDRGNPSPKFDFENHKGGKTTLDDLKGKFVYIDVWATWCGPCISEIPYLKEVEQKYHGKNIEFVSISVDKKRDYEKWKNYVTNEGLVGTQLVADDAFNSAFISAYEINAIPRFILIDTEGNIISADAPRPSNNKLIELFTELGI